MEVDLEEVVVQTLLNCALLPSIPWKPPGEGVEDDSGGGDEREGVDSKGGGKSRDQVGPSAAWAERAGRLQAR